MPDIVGFYTDEQGRKRPITPKSRKGFSKKQTKVVRKPQVKKVPFDALVDLRESGNEGIVLMGAGGNLQEWRDGVSKILYDEGITKTKDAKKLWQHTLLTETTGGRRDLLLTFKKDADFDMGKMAMWRLRFGNCSWLSDYVVNYADQHGYTKPTSVVDKPRVTLIGQSGNAFYILGACNRAGRKAGWSKERLEAFRKEATSGDYDHLLQTATKHFDVE